MVASGLPPPLLPSLGLSHESWVMTNERENWLCPWSPPHLGQFECLPTCHDPLVHCNLRLFSSLDHALLISTCISAPLHSPLTTFAFAWIPHASPTQNYVPSLAAAFKSASTTPNYSFSSSPINLAPSLIQFVLIAQIKQNIYILMNWMTQQRMPLINIPKKRVAMPVQN